MHSCLLCLRSAKTFNSYIPVHSRKWLEAANMIEKHFWPIGNVQNKLGICFSCWSKMSEFNKFYESIKEAHRSDIQRFKMEEELANCDVENQIFPTSIQKSKYALTSNESNFTNGENDDIKYEGGVNEIESILCVPTSPVESSNEEMVLNSLPVQKRKRGRPRKLQTVIVKPKGKRGRPRKNNLDKNVRHEVSCFLKDVINQSNYTTDTIRQDRLPKKRRGRPPKIQQNDENHISKTIDELVKPNDDMNSVNQCSKVQDEILEDVPSDLNQTENKARKKFNFLRVMKKRKRLQHHRVLMRNYIATSVRCMKFLKK